MGELIDSVENELIDIIRQDNSEKMISIITKNNINKNTLIGPHKRTLIQLCSYFGSINCLENLIKMNFDINELEISSNNSPLFIACKFNFLEIVYLLLNNNHQKCEILRKSNDGLNEFEVAFLRGNYAICYYLLYEYKNINDICLNKYENNYNDSILKLNIKENGNNGNYKKNNTIKENEYIRFFNDINFSLEKYLGIQEYLLYPLFNLPLFYKSLKQKINPEKCPSFSVERKKTKDLLTKIPDPNETWSNFLKRIVKFELYNPPLVNKNKISKSNSLYMKTQMKMISMEYGITMDYCNPKDLKVNNFINENEEDNLLIINNNNEKIYKKDENEINKKSSNNKFFKINFRNNLNKLNLKSNDKKKDNNNKIISYENLNNNFDNTSDKKKISK